MLILSRSLDETIVAGDITIRVIEVTRSGRVRLGIDAPPGVRIVRGELLTRDEAASSTPHAEPANGKEHAA